MKIYADEATTQFKTYTQEPGLLWGHEDVLVGDTKNVHRFTYSMFGRSHQEFTYEPKLYLHFSNTTWSTFTGILRQYCLPWRWETAYVTNGSKIEPVLVCTSIDEGDLSDRIKAILGKSLFVATLIQHESYREILDKEFLCIPAKNPFNYVINNTVVHPWGKWAGVHYEFTSKHTLCHIYRIRGIYSLIMYTLLKHFSNEWEETTIKVENLSETLLIQKKDKHLLNFEKDTPPPVRRFFSSLFGG